MQKKYAYPLVALTALTLLVLQARAQTTAPAANDCFTLNAKELFGTDHALIERSHAELDRYAKMLLRSPDVKNVTVRGYTDHLGALEHNQELSQRRAEAVKDYLVKRGVDPSRLTAVGMGPADPVVTNCSGAGAALAKCLAPNRRVELDGIAVRRISPPAASLDAEAIKR